jgi:hypothetical protein
MLRHDLVDHFLKETDHAVLRHIARADDPGRLNQCLASRVKLKNGVRHGVSLLRAAPVEEEELKLEVFYTTRLTTSTAGQLVTAAASKNTGGSNFSALLPPVHHVK